MNRFLGRTVGQARAQFGLWAVVSLLYMFLAFREVYAEDKNWGLIILFGVMMVSCQVMSLLNLHKSKEIK